MSLAHNPKVVQSGLVGYWDAANLKSYTETPGDNLVINGGFDSTASWVTSSQFSITDGKLHCVCDGTYSYCIQNNVFTIGKSYVIEVDISTHTLGSIRIRPESFSPFTSFIADGHYRFYVLNATHGTLYIERNNACDMYVDNISVKEISETWNDLSGNRNTGTLVSGSSYNTGSGGNIQFDGTDDYVDFSSDLPTTSNAFSVSIWLYPNNWSTNTEEFVIISDAKSAGSQGLAIASYQSGAQIRINRNAAAHPFYAVPTEGGWTNIVVTAIDFTTDPLVYYNGILQAVIEDTGYATPTTDKIGVRNAGQEFNGRIANIMMYSKTLSQAEITQNFNAHRSRFSI